MATELAMVAHMEDMVATGPTAATAALTVMATESRQQPEHPTPHEQPQIAQYELKNTSFIFVRTLPIICYQKHNKILASQKI